MYNKIELDYKPLEIMDKLLPACKGKNEMSSHEMAFLCGMIKEKRPHIILELGVSAGGTTAVILESVSKYSTDTRVISIDCAEQWYQNPDYESGFVAKEACKLLSPKVDFQLLLGKYPIEYFEAGRIQESIDFVIIDTMHVVPGEILDFLSIYPYLSKNATVVLHDVQLNLLTHHADYSYATRLLFDTVKAKKYYMFEAEDNILSNIAAFQLTNETESSMIDIVSLLGVTWTHTVEACILEKYRNVIKTYYEKQTLLLFDRIIKMQEEHILIESIERHYGHNSHMLIHNWRKQKKVVIYGDGFWGKKYREFAKLRQLRIDGIVISDDQEIQRDDGRKLPIWKLQDCPFSPKECAFIIALDISRQDFIASVLFKRGYTDIINV